MKRNYRFYYSREIVKPIFFNLYLGVNMSNLFIILLRNNHLIFTEKKPKRRGNYTQDVRLFKIKGSVSCEDVFKWGENDHSSKGFTEVKDWE